MRGFFISVTRTQKKKEQWLIDCAENNDFEAWSGESPLVTDYPFDLIEQFKLSDDGMWSIKPEE